jgi:hypothetical protein
MHRITISDYLTLMFDRLMTSILRRRAIAYFVY